MKLPSCTFMLWFDWQVTLGSKYWSAKWYIQSGSTLGIRCGLLSLGLLILSILDWRCCFRVWQDFTVFPQADFGLQWTFSAERIPSSLQSSTLCVSGWSDFNLIPLKCFCFCPLFKKWNPKSWSLKLEWLPATLTFDENSSDIPHIIPQLISKLSSIEAVLLGWGTLCKLDLILFDSVITP